jgi:hypothetical protein
VARNICIVRPKSGKGPERESIETGIEGIEHALRLFGTLRVEKARALKVCPRWTQKRGWAEWVEELGYSGRDHVYLVFPAEARLNFHAAESKRLRRASGGRSRGSGAEFKHCFIRR